jgi:hypothetical protein
VARLREQNHGRKTVKRRLEEIDGQLADGNCAIFSTVAKLVNVLMRERREAKRVRTPLALVDIMTALSAASTISTSRWSFRTRPESGKSSGQGLPGSTG